MPKKPCRFGSILLANLETQFLSRKDAVLSMHNAPNKALQLTVFSLRSKPGVLQGSSVCRSNAVSVGQKLTGQHEKLPK